MMEVTEVKYRRVKNLGNYESEEVSMTAVPGEGEDFNTVLAQVKNNVLAGLGLVEEVEAVVEAAEVAVETTVAEKKAKAKATAKKVKETIKEEKKEKKTAKRVAKKAVKYTRENVDHKKQLQRVLDDLVPTWKSDKKVLQLAKKFSVEVAEGQPFLDSKGEVLGTFTDLVNETFGEAVDTDL